MKRARLTVKRGAARPNGKSKPPQSPLRRAVRYRIRGAARHSTQGVLIPLFFFLLYAAWVRSRAERPSVSYTKVVSKVARTGHNLHLQRRIKQQNCGSNKFLHRGDGKMERMLEPSIKLIGEVHRMSGWLESGFRCSAGQQTHWQDASKGGVQIRACVDLRGRLGARKWWKWRGVRGNLTTRNWKGRPRIEMQSAGM